MAGVSGRPSKPPLAIPQLPAGWSAGDPLAMFCPRWTASPLKGSGGLVWGPHHTGAESVCKEGIRNDS